MITTKFDTASKLHLSFPDRNKPLDIASTVETFIDYDQSRPPEEQLPHTPKLVGLLQQWNESDHKRLAGESQRGAAAETVEKLDKEMIEYVRRMRKTLDATFPDVPAQAKAWGFRVKQSTKNILVPRTRRDHLTLLDKYIAKEQSRPEAERFASPDLVEITRVRDDLRDQLKIRLAGQNQREKAVADGNLIIVAMYNYLQAAAVRLLAFNFDFVLTVELQNWGYDVMPRRAASAEEEAIFEALTETETTPAVTSEAASPEANPTNGSFTNGSPDEVLNPTAKTIEGGWE